MATITAPTLTIVPHSEKFGWSKATAKFNVSFDKYDKAADQPYAVILELYGDDTNVGDPASEGADDRNRWIWEYGAWLSPSNVGPNPQTYPWDIENTYLNEDASANATDEIRLVVTLKPQTAKTVTAEAAQLVTLPI
jgi:hypothetical protein